MADAANAHAGDDRPPPRRFEAAARSESDVDLPAHGLRVAPAPAEPPAPTRTVIVDPAVSTAKLQRELDDWAATEATYRRRGILLRHVGGPIVEVSFLRRAQVFPAPFVAACIRLDYTNYDLEPPSLMFANPFTGGPGTPYLPILHVDPATKSVQPLVPDGVHPATGLPFLCIPGTWEFHSHMEHTNEPWLSEPRRNRGGSIAVLTTRIANALDHVQFGFTYIPMIQGTNP